MHKTFHNSVLIIGLAAAFTLMTMPVDARGGGFGGGARGGGGFGGAGGGGFSSPDMSQRPSYPSNANLQTPRTNVNSGTFNQANVNRAGTYPANRAAVNTGNVNVGNTVNVNGSDWGWGGSGYWGAAAVGATAGAITGAAVAGSAAGPSTVVYSLPSGCTPVVVNGVTYQSCGGAYYQPQYQGSTVVYQQVNP